MKGELVYGEYAHTLIGKKFEDNRDLFNKTTVVITTYSEDNKGYRMFRGDVYNCGKLRIASHGMKAENVEQLIESGLFKEIQ